VKKEVNKKKVKSNSLSTLLTQVLTVMLLSAVTQILGSDSQNSQTTGA